VKQKEKGMFRPSFPIVIAIALLSLSQAGSAAVLAQDATAPASGSLLAAMGYPEVRIRVTEDTYELPAAPVAVGRTLITLDNVGQESWHGLLLRLPDGVSDEQVATELGPETQEPPAWLFEATFPGFPGETLPGERRQAVVDLTAGRYLIVGDVAQRFDVGEAAATPEVGAPPVTDGAVRLFEFGFAFPDALAPGRQVWAVTNDGSAPHELLLAWSPEPVTAEQIVEMFANESEDENATPVGGGPSFAEMEPVGGLGWLSPGLTAWAEVDLRPGTYVVLCFVFDPATGMPHAAMGMVDVFTVAEEGGTPAA
jgi:hypothetical protein